MAVFLLTGQAQAPSSTPLAHYRQHGPALLNDLSYSPGVANPEVNQANIQRTVCVSGWTKTVRPPASLTNKLKLEQMKAYGDAVPQVPPLAAHGYSVDVRRCVAHSDDPRCYEEDHIESLQLGGCPSCPGNLFPQPYYPKPGAHEKDAVETWLKRQVCAGKISLADAQRKISQDWYAVYLERLAARR